MGIMIGVMVTLLGGMFNSLPVACTGLAIGTVSLLWAKSTGREEW